MENTKRNYRPMKEKQKLQYRSKAVRKDIYNYVLEGEVNNGEHGPRYTLNQKKRRLNAK